MCCRCVLYDQKWHLVHTGKHAASWMFFMFAVVQMSCNCQHVFAYICLVIGLWDVVTGKA